MEVSFQLDFVPSMFRQNWANTNIADCCAAQLDKRRHFDLKDVVKDGQLVMVVEKLNFSVRESSFSKHIITTIIHVMTCYFNQHTQFR